MTRAERQIGDKVVIVAVDGTTSPKKYELVPAQNNYSYQVVSDQPEAQPNQPLVMPLTFHGGFANSTYDSETAGYIINTGLDCHEPNVIRAPILPTTITLTGAANPPNYYLETAVNDGGADDGQPVAYVIANEAAEINVYKVSLDSGDFGTLLNTKTFAVTPTQPMGRPVEWNDGTNTRWYLGLGDNNFIQELTTIVSSTAADTWTASSDADARYLKVVGNRLMRSTDENQVSLLARGADPLTEANWGSDFFVGDVSANITELGEASGLGYIAKEDGWYEWDTVGEAQNVFPEIGKATRNGQGMIYWHGGFVMPAASGLWWTRKGRPIGPDSNPNNRANHPNTASGSNKYIKHGLWQGVAAYGAHLYGLYIDSSGTSTVLWGREREESDPPGWGPLIWHGIGTLTGDRDDFHGLIVAETGEHGATDIRPVLLVPDQNDVAWFQLDRDGAPVSRRGDIDITKAATFVDSGDIDWQMPTVLKQLRVIDGVAENMATGDIFRTNVSRDGGATVALASDITTDGVFEQFWTQDSADTARSIMVAISWSRASDRADTNGPALKNVRVRAVTLPDTSQIWTFNFLAEDNGKTSKKKRSELEGYLQDLKQYELPSGDTFNGVMTSLRLLRVDEIRDLKPANQPPPKYVLQAEVRQMVSA